MLSERRATNIGLLYPKVCNNIGGIFPLTSPNQNIGDVSPAGLTPVMAIVQKLATFWISTLQMHDGALKSFQAD